MPRPWRLLLDDPADGPWNMGVDEALLASVARGAAPALRLYRWDGPWLSLGYAQPVEAARLAACAAAGVGVVRRITGGRAVLHGNDLTYAVAAPADCLPAGIRATYGHLTEALLLALRRLGVAGVHAQLGRGRPGAPSFDCFAEAAAEELVAAGGKLVGSAQRRLAGAVLQHGSVRLGPDPEAARTAAGVGAAGSTSLAELGQQVDPAPLCQALVDTLAVALDAVFEEVGITPWEARRAESRRKLHVAEPPLCPPRVP